MAHEQSPLFGRRIALVALAVVLSWSVVLNMNWALICVKLVPSHSPVKEQQLPKWIQDYFSWHRRMRREWNGKLLHKNSTKLLIFRNFNGLHDRLHDLPLAVYLANRSQRLLMMRWSSPAPLEEFLVPNMHYMDWTVPQDIARQVDSSPPNLFNGQDVPNVFAAESDHRDYFWNTAIDKYVHSNRKEPILLLQQHLRLHPDPEFVRLLQRAGESNPIYGNAAYGHLWHAIFQPSPPLQDYINRQKAAMGIANGQPYIAVHLRSRYPSYFNGSMQWDGNGLQFSGKPKEITVRATLHALQCARTLQTTNITTTSKDEPIYLFTDSANLTDYFAHQLLSNTTSLHDDIDEEAKRIVSQLHIVARTDVAHDETLHLQQKARVAGPASYYNIFADLYLAMQARCILYGVGGFGRFGAQLSHTRCYRQHHDLNEQRRSTPVCIQPNDLSMH